MIHIYLVIDRQRNNAQFIRGNQAFTEKEDALDELAKGEPAPNTTSSSVVEFIDQKVIETKR